MIYDKLQSLMSDIELQQMKMRKEDTMYYHGAVDALEETKAKLLDVMLEIQEETFRAKQSEFADPMVYKGI